MSKQPNISRLSGGFRSSNKLNENIEEIKSAFDNTLSRDGSGPNQMEAPIDMNGNQLLNLPEPVGPTSPLRVSDLTITPVDIASLITSSLPIVIGGRPVATSLADRLSKFIDLSADYGVKADGITPNQELLINQAILEALSYDTPVRLVLPPGQVVLNGPLVPLTKSIILEGDSLRLTQLRPQGNFDVVTIGTGSSRVPNAGLRNIGFNAAGMTGGTCIVVDWCQGAILDNVLVADPFNGVSVRQSGNTVLKSVIVDGVRGNFGVKAIGPGGTRNGEIDKIDVLIFQNTLVQSVYVPGGPLPTARLIELDGWVHTVQFFDVRLLSGLSGLRTLNSYGLAQKFTPSFLYGVVETENTYSMGIHLQWANDVKLWKVFTASSTSESGIEVGDNAVGIDLNVTSQNNWKFGCYVSGGAKDVSLYEPKIEHNNQANANLAGIEDASGNLRVYGGRSGSATQAYGLRGVAGTRAFDVDLRNNAVSPTTGDVQAIRCLPTGAGRVPSNTVTVGASPFTYTVGSRNVSVGIYGGNGVTATIDGVFQIKSTPGNFMAPAGSQIVINHAGAPDMAVTPL